MATTQDNFTAFATAESTMSSATPTALNGRSIYRFAPAGEAYRVAPPGGNVNIPIHVRTGAQTFGAPDERKKFQQIEFHGTGSLYVRVYVDGVWIADSSVTMTETPAKDRRLGLPVGTRGYSLDVEFCGDASPRVIEYTITPLSSTS